MFFGEKFNEEKIMISYDGIIPPESAPPEIKENATYFFYIQGITRRSLDDKLRFYRQKSLVGELDSQDYHELNSVLEVAKKHAQHKGYMMPLGKETGMFYAYARAKSYAMLIAQILFVNNCVKEGLIHLLDEKSISSMLERMSKVIRRFSQDNSSIIGDDESRFYATLFLFQTAFDKIFVPTEKIITYGNTEKGEYKITELWEKSISYLELTNSKVISACDEEKELCYNITTGWSTGINRKTWDLLNEYYYKAISPTTGQANLFAKNYDNMLERMLPQFTLSKVKLAETLVGDKKRGEKINVLEIGAGSGAFAIDLFMASNRFQIPVSEIEYIGIEPSEFMRLNFKDNMAKKLGSSSKLPVTWKLEDGALESITMNPEKYISGNTIIVFSYCLHHCFCDSVAEFFNNAQIKKLVPVIYALDVVQEHGWTKPYYMWADCESPENFDNVTAKGLWSSKTVWILPSTSLEGHATTNAWCFLRKLS